jgi:hypothetical protein
VEAWRTPHVRVLALRVDGRLDPDVAGRAVNDVITRHDVLRTLVREQDGETRQYVLSPAQAELVPVSEDLGDVDLNERLETERQRPFDLLTELPMRVILVRTPEEGHVVLFAVHGIAADDLSMSLLCDDFSKAYRARRDGVESGLTPLPLRHSDYVSWRHESLGILSDDESTWAKQVEHWRKMLAGAPQRLPLPADRTPPAVRTRLATSCVLELGRDVHQEVTALSRATGTTVFMVLQTSVSAFLTKIECGTDVLVGTTVSGRTDEALRDLVGSFANIVVLRTDTSGDPTFADLLRRVRSVAFGVYANQDLPIDVVLAESGVSPVQVEVALRRDCPRERGPLQVAVAEKPRLSAGLDLVFEFREHQVGGIRCRIDCSTDLFSEEAAEAMCARFAFFLRSWLRDPGQPLSAVEMGLPAEQAAVALTPRQAELCRIFAEVFGRAEVGQHDNFFVLGGHSMLAVKAVSKIRSELRVELSMRDLFEAPTVAQLSERLAEAPQARPSLTRMSRS